MVWLRNFFLVGCLALLGVVVQALSGRAVGWGILAIGTILLLAIHLRNLQRTLLWAQQLDTPPPSAAGGWGEMLARVYRQMRARDRDLAESRETLQAWLAAAQALPDGVVVLDHELHIDWCNREACRLLGLRFPADRGQQLLNLARGPDFVRYAQQSSWPDSALVTSPASPAISLRVQIIRYSRERRLLVVRDVTQFERLERMRRDFVANVSHELRTPLTVLSGFLETVDEAPEGALERGQMRQYFGLMREQASRMQNIVADLLTLSTLESTQAQEHPGAAGMPDIIKGAREQAQALSAGRHNLRWHIDDTLDVKGVAAELTSAVANLVTNAVRYTPDGGEIAVRWEVAEDGGPVFAVQDTGVGISAVHLPRLTERFYRVDRGRSRASGGTGLGLAITKQVAVRHDAVLDIISEAERGSTFRIVFSAERRCVPAPAKPEAPKLAPRKLSTEPKERKEAKVSKNLKGSKEAATGPSREPAQRVAKARSARAELAVEATAVDGDATPVAEPDGR